MYEQTFQFSSRPFNNVPRIEDFFAGTSYQQAMDVAHMCVDRSTGPVVVVGSVGMGKSLMLQKIGQSFDSRFDVVHIECSRLEERSELLQSILFELKLPYAGLAEGELRLSLMGYLKENKGDNDGVLLLVDEADRLSVELIDELRLITNQIRDGRSLVQLVLAGTQRLEDSLTDAKLASFNQRIAARCVLQNLSKSETEQFIYQHIQQAGRSGGDIFDDEAIDEIHQNTDGCPRLINQLCDQSLLLAASRNKQPVDRPLIREAWAEMQNMPVVHEVADSVNADSSSESGFVVEFGQLGDNEAASQFEDSHVELVGEDPFAAQPSNEDADNEDSKEYLNEDEVRAEGQDYEDTVDDQSDEVTVDDNHDAEGEGAAASAPDGRHATAAALAATAFAANAVNSDPFAPQEEDRRLEDGNTESERIASLEQEQNELLDQTRGQDASGSEEVRSAFEDLGLDQQGVEPPVVDEMIPANPFQLPESAENSSDADEENEPSPASFEVETAVEATGNAWKQEEDLSPMAQCSIEEQLGLVEPDVPEQTSFHTPAFEPRPYVESESFQNQSDESSQDEDTDSFAPAADSIDPFAESFEEEEMLQDAYSPFVAEQNQASLEVTSSQLSHLTPLDAVDDTNVDEDSNQWNSQTPELAIEELDATGVSTDSIPAELEAISEGDFLSTKEVQATEAFSPTHSSPPPVDVWQNNKETAWDPSQYKVPAEVESETPASFHPVPSVSTELGPISHSTEDAPQGTSAFNEDPFAPQEPAQEETVYPQSQVAPPIDEDLEALTSDLDSIATFDLDGDPHVSEVGTVNSEEHCEEVTSGLMDLNDLVPGHMLEQMEATNHVQNESVPNAAAGGEVSDDAFASKEANEYSRESFAVPEQSAGFAVPYSAHASVNDSVSPEAAAQAEARRKTEEFMRNFHAQRDLQVSSDSEQVQPIEPPAVSDGFVAQPEGQSQEILKEIFSQQQILDNVHYTEPSASLPEQSSETPVGNDQLLGGLGADSVSVETPVTGYPSYQQAGEPPAAEDDRDMLYVNETQSYSPPQAPEPPQPPPFPNVETSTGNAQRMDYNQLFDQLRNSTPEQ